MEKRGLGVLGLGEGRSIISGAMQSEMWDVKLARDLEETLCREMNDLFSLPEYTVRYEEMLGNPEIDMIGVYTPDHLHSKHILMALEAGKHII